MTPKVSGPLPVEIIPGGPQDDRPMFWTVLGHIGASKPKPSPKKRRWLGEWEFQNWNELRSLTPDSDFFTGAHP